MSIKNDNKCRMRQGFPELYQRVYEHNSEKKIEKDFIIGVNHLSTPSGKDALVIEASSGEIYRMNSMYDPENEAKIWAAGQEIIASNILVFGLGSGYFVKEILKKRKKGSRILIYEPSARVFLYALSHFDLSFCFSEPGIRVIVEGLNDDMFGNVMEEMVTLENCEDYEFIFCPQMVRVFPEERKRLVERYASDGIGRVNTARNNIRWTLHIQPYNLLHNIQYLKENTVVPKLAKVWEKEVPIVIVGAGPSLEQEIDVLRNIKEKAFFFAVDSALPFLLANGLIPDAFFCAEADKPMRFFDNPAIREIPMFGKISTTHKLMDIHSGPKIFGYEDGFSEQFYQKYKIPESVYRYGANCATSLFAVSKELGAKTVILVAQDMVYGENGVSHAGGRDEGDYFKGDIFTCVNNEGKTVQTRYDWFCFLRWYENAILSCKFEHVVNTSLKGARIRGAEVLPLQEAIECYGCTHSEFYNILQKAEKTFGSVSFDEIKFYNECYEEIEKISDLVKKNPWDENRKTYFVYNLLKLYEIADEEDDFEQSQRSGIMKIKEYLDMCMKEENS